VSGGRDGHAAPPRLATRLLEAALPTDRRGRSIVGDLMEEWHGRRPGTARTLWYWAECLRVGRRYLLVRRRLPGVPPTESPGESAWRRRMPALPFNDLRQALRSALRAPTVSILSVLALGVGVAAPTVMYSLLVGVTRDLPVPEPTALVHVGRRYTEAIIRQAPLDWLQPLLEVPSAGAGAGLESVGAFSLARYDISAGEGFPERLQGAAVTPGVFRTLRVEPALGRALTEGDATAGDPVAVVSDAIWRERFGAEPGALGRQIRVDGQPHTVVGVMPRGFGFPDDAVVWLPLEPSGQEAARSAELIGRLEEGASVAGLRQRVAALMDEVRVRGATESDLRRPLDAEAWSDRSIGPNELRMLRLMVLLVSLVLVIATANVAHLFLARTLARRTQTAVRVALGAGRARVVRQHVAEAAVLAAVGGLLGFGIAALGVRALAAGMAPRLGWWMVIGLDPVVILFCAGLVTLAALVTGVVPALHASKVDVANMLREEGRSAAGGRGIARLTGLLVAGEVALTCTLLVIAGLLTRGALRTLDTHGEFATATVLAASYELHPDRYSSELEVDVFHRELVARASASPDVAAAGLVSHLPGIYAPSERVEVEGERYERPEDRPPTHVVYASPGFLDALAVAPLRGRDLSWSDARDAPLAALVNEPFARKHLGGRDPLGVRVRLAPEERPRERHAEADPLGAGPLDADSTDDWAMVVGVVPALGLRTGRDPDDTGIYLPVSTSTMTSAYLLVRAAPGVTAGALAPAMRRVAAGLDPDLALQGVASLEEHLRANRDMERLFAILFAFFGGSGLVLAGVGLYGLVAFTMGRRVRELGIRSALGARPGLIAWTAVRGGALQVTAGLVLGLVLAAAIAPLLGDRFMGYDAQDWAAYGTATATLLITALAAALGPTRRALSVSVGEVLRAE